MRSHLDDPGCQLDWVAACELLVVVKLAHVIFDPGRLGGEYVVGEGSDPGSAGVIDRVRLLPVEDLVNGSFPACLAQLSTDVDEFLVERFLLA